MLCAPCYALIVPYTRWALFAAIEHLMDLIMRYMGLYSLIIAMLHISVHMRIMSHIVPEMRYIGPYEAYISVNRAILEHYWLNSWPIGKKRANNLENENRNIF